MTTENLIHWPLIVRELEDAGYIAEFNGHAVVVTLDYSPLSVMEVIMALDYIFEGIKFEVKSTDEGVTVR